MIASGTEGVGGLTSFVAVAKHVSGNTYYAVDGDATAIYFDEDPGSEGTLLVVGNIPASVVGVNDFVGVNGPSGANWSVR